MTEYFGSSAESDDDDKESKPSKATKPLGEILLRRDENEGASESKHETLWERLGLSSEDSKDKSEKPSLLSFIEKNEGDEAESKSEATEELSDEEERLATLEPAEEKAVVEEDSSQRTSDLAAEAEVVEQGSVEEASVIAAEKFHDKLNEKLTDESKSAEEAIEEAGQETATEIGTPEELPSAQQPEATVLPPTPEMPPAQDAEEDAPVPSAGGGAGTQPPTGSGGTVSSGGPTPPFAGGLGFGPMGGVPTPNAAPGFNTITPEHLAAAERHGENTGLVVGGIVGYLIGRRRGRIKAEKRLLPVQEKLEKQVKKLHESVAAREWQIRNLAAEKARALDRAKREAFVEQLRTQPKAAKATPFSTPAARETRSMLQQPASAEAVQAGPTQAEAPIPARQLERVERMNHAELLEISSRVLIDGTSLRTIYEARQITEKGLRHIIAEHLAGRDIKRALNEELLIKQMTYERDPQLRDQFSASSSNTTNSVATPAAAVPNQLSVADGRRHMLEAAGALATNPPHEQSDIPNQSLDSARRLERVIVNGWIALVAVLVIVILLLLKHRGGL